MGLLSKSILILLIAVSTPLIYRQFANDNTVKFMSSYYSNYKSIDQFLRQSAGHLDRAKQYLPDSDQLKGVVNNLNKQFNTLIESTKSAVAKSTTSSDEKSTTKTPSKEKQQQQQPEAQPKKERIKLPRYMLTQCPTETVQVRLWSKQELEAFDGRAGEQEIYLAFLGLVYNVTVNLQHYGGGSEYNAFAGRDATRAFVTGNFTHDLHDDISDIDQGLYSHIESWASFYNTSYQILGRLEGRFYDSNGCSTPELARVYQVFQKIEQDKENRRDQEKGFPECNSEWNSDLKKGRVWCSTKSGGVDRNWVGVPRIYQNGESQRCACFNQDGPEAAEVAKYMHQYPGCDPTAFECPLNQA